VPYIELGAIATITERGFRLLFRTRPAPGGRAMRCRHPDLLGAAWRDGARGCLRIVLLHEDSLSACRVAAASGDAMLKARGQPLAE
jgi:hypothetical protein